MTRLPSVTLCAALLASLAYDAAPARAADAEPSPFRASVLGGYGGGEPGAEVWKIGVGASLGYTFPVPIYVGLSSTYHFGTREEGEPRDRMSYYTGNLGYAFRVGRVTITPQAAVGAAVVRTIRDVHGGFVSWCVGPAIDLDIAVSRQLFVATSLRYLVIATAVQNGDVAYVIGGPAFYAGAGLRF